jgi:pimeloyl-ACP methyl ester carboxylesterase
MHSRARYAVDAAHPARCAVVFMPGFADDDRGFIDHGFVDALRARGLAVDTVSAAATFGYYLDRSIVVRLREDVMRPLRARGYREVWIVGISMGGLGTVLLARDQSPNIAGIVLLARISEATRHFARSTAPAASRGGSPVRIPAAARPTTTARSGCT